MPALKPEHRGALERSDRGKLHDLRKEIEELIANLIAGIQRFLGATFYFVNCCSIVTSVGFVARAFRCRMRPGVP